jgi:hypothetical protein
VKVYDERMKAADIASATPYHLAALRINLAELLGILFTISVRRSEGRETLGVSADVLSCWTTFSISVNEISRL